VEENGRRKETHSTEGGPAEKVVERDEGEGDLERSTPSHLTVLHQVGDSKSIDRLYEGGRNVSMSS
jgi:hypothetical protein